MVDEAHKAALTSMFDNVIKDKSEEAEIDFHGYLQDKMQEMFGTKVPSDEAEKDTNEE